MEKIRAFIAIELPEEARRTLARLQERLKSGCRAPVRWADPDATHLTLKFLGYIDAADTGKIITAVTGAARGITPFRLFLGGMGVFPSPGHVRVVWVGLEGELDKLNGMQKGIESAMETLGFPPEGRPFAPHLTLGRVRDNARPDERQELGRLVASTPGKTNYTFDAGSVNLMKSQLTPQGPIYTRIGSVELK